MCDVLDSDYFITTFTAFSPIFTIPMSLLLRDVLIEVISFESQTVGPEDAPMDVHLIMLGAEIVLLEGIRLGAVEDGVYLLNAAPINLGGADGAPCRAFLLSV